MLQKCCKHFIFCQICIFVLCVFACYGIVHLSYERKQIQRAKNIIENPGVATRNLNDPKRFINVAAITEDGEIAEKKIKSLNIEAIKK